MKKKLMGIWKPWIWVVLPALAALVVACGGAAEAPSPANQRASEPVAAEAVAKPGAPAPTAVAGGYGDGASTVDDILANAMAQAQGPRVIIYTGNISLVVKDTRQAVQAITALAAEQGGYVSDSNIYQDNEVPRGSVTIRVPAENFQDTLARLRNMAVRVESESTNSQDVTEEFTDLEARKTNLEFTEEALQTLLEERQRVGKTSDILEVYRELTQIRGQIEQIEGRMRYLANQSALSTIQIALTPDVLYQPVSVAGWEPQGVAKQAVQALVAALQGLANILIWVVIFILPLLVIILLPVVVLIWLIRWWWKRRKKRQAAASPPAGKAEAAG